MSDKHLGLCYALVIFVPKQKSGAIYLYELNIIKDGSSIKEVTNKTNIVTKNNSKLLIGKYITLFIKIIKSAIITTRINIIPPKDFLVNLEFSKIRLVNIIKIEYVRR